MAPSIAQERSRLAKVDGAPTLRRREQWGAAHNYTRARTVTDPATRVFVHISVTNPNSYNGNDAHARAIEAIGRARFGRSSSNTGISYNRGVMPNGSLYEMQPMGRRGAHTVNNYGISTCTRSGTGCPGRGQSITAPSGNLNYNARAYVICQNVDDPVTDEQIDQLARQIVADYQAGLITRHAAHHPHGHRCVSAKSCPGNRMWARMGDLHDRIHHYLENGLDGGSTVSYPEIWKKDGSMRPPEGRKTKSNPHWQPERMLEEVGDFAAGRMQFMSPYLRKEVRKGKRAFTRWLIEWIWHYAKGARQRATEAREASRANGKQIGELAAQVSALSSAVEQLSAGGIDLAAVQQAAEQGAASAWRHAEVSVAFDQPDEPEDEPDEDDA